MKKNFDDYSLVRQSDPICFSKRACIILGNGEAITGRFDLDERLDYEAELAVVIEKNGKDIRREDAEDYIFGYSVFNDVSSRKMQKRHTQWFKGKSLDTYSAMGPVIATRDEFTFPPELEVICRVNGEERQRSNTRLMLTDIPSMIQDLSAGMTLVPGDIIASGTPSGVAVGMTPSVFLKKGDVVECEIPEIGILSNSVQ